MAFICLPACRLAVTVSALLLLWSCATSGELDLVLDESPQSAVYLERIPDRSFHAAHPITIDQDTITRVFKGIHVKEDHGLLRGLMTDANLTMPAFSEEEIRYLAPLVTEGFRRAASDQQVGFRMAQSGNGRSRSVGAAVGSEPGKALSSVETTRGFIYAYGRSLYLTLTEYRVQAERPDTINMANRRIPDTTGLMHRSVSFTPESAVRPEHFRSRPADKTTLVINYELLATLPTDGSPTSSLGRASSPVATPAGSTRPPDGDTTEQLRVLQEQMRQKNRELEALRKELQDIRRRLIEPSAAGP